ncbi:hypothetical protein [Rhodoferax sp. PAMC 29310]|uniref:hypothetical protein n=1 Tax=Rhodoferax sp. PAMC 29310 TaxID=2822760 RepID=UPI001B3207DB|nr:hypothetical protein [Rhodoferax sp. PAMC 29310]
MQRLGDRFTAQAKPVTTSEGAPAVVPLGNEIHAQSESLEPKRSPVPCLWVVLFAHIY